MQATIDATSTTIVYYIIYYILLYIIHCSHQKLAINQGKWIPRERYYCYYVITLLLFSLCVHSVLLDRSVAIYNISIQFIPSKTVPSFVVEL